MEVDSEEGQSYLQVLVTYSHARSKLHVSRAHVCTFVQQSFSHLSKHKLALQQMRDRHSCSQRLQTSEHYRLP